MVWQWHRLPREAVAAPSLAVFKARLDGALSNLVWWKVSLPMAWLGLDARLFPTQTHIPAHCRGIALDDL